MNLLDSLVWLVNFPVTHGYAITFIAAFSMIGCFLLAVRSQKVSVALTALREREGLPSASQPRPRTEVLSRIRRIFFGVLGLVMLGSLILGILATMGVPLTRGYIHANGVPTTGEVDGGWVSFTSNAGVEYTLRNDSFTPSVHPNTRSYVGSGEPVVIRYLPSHPQAYVIDTTQSPQ